MSYIVVAFSVHHVLLFQSFADSNADAERKEIRSKGTAHNSVSQRSILLAGFSLKRIILVLILAGCRRTAVSPVNGTVQGLSIILCDQSCDQLVKLLIN